MIDSWDVLKLISDPTRLRLINLLQQEELAVAELQKILGMGQSRISSHLGLLRQGDIVIDRKEGKKSYYSLHPKMDKVTRQLIQTACASISDKTEVKEDLQSLQHAIEKRRRETEQYFNAVAGRLGKNYCPGRSWEAIGHFLINLTPKITMADLGAGDGMIAQLLAHHADKLYCIDSSPKMVEVGRELAEKYGIDNLIYEEGHLENIPLDDASVDVAYMSQALHHSQHPQVAVNEAFRILKPGGKILILDLKEHTFEKARELYADQWLGFKENTLYTFLKNAGFQKIDVNVVAKEEVEPNFETIIACGIK